jgi:hypothetical protein
MTLRIKLEVVPHGNEAEAYEIGRLDIFNKGRAGSSEYHEYGLMDWVNGKREPPETETVLHKRSDGAWELVRHVLAIHKPKTAKNDSLKAQTGAAHCREP